MFNTYGTTRSLCRSYCLGDPAE